MSYLLEMQGEVVRLREVLEAIVAGDVDEKGHCYGTLSGSQCVEIAKKALEQNPLCVV